MSKYPEQLNRDNLKCKVLRERKWMEICFTDLTPDEQQRILSTNDAAYICRCLTEIIRNDANK